MSYGYFNELMYGWRYVCVCMCMSVLCLRDLCFFCVTFPALAFSYLFVNTILILHVHEKQNKKDTMYIIRVRVFDIHLWLKQSLPALLSSFVYRMKRSKGRLNTCILILWWCQTDQFIVIKLSKDLFLENFSYILGCPSELICISCGKAYAHSSSLTRHTISAHRGKGNPCDLCQKKCPTLTPLNRQEKANAGNVTQKIHIHLSSKAHSYTHKHKHTANHTSTLKQHKLRTSTASDFICDTCGKTFTDKAFKAC